MKETAVQMLISRLPNIDWTDPYYRDILNEAVDKEREQIIDAAQWMPFPFDGIEFLPELANQYYNETYKLE